MEVTDELFESFLIANTEVDAWNQPQRAAVYGRITGGKWTQIEAFDDPYNAGPLLVASTVADDTEGMLLMYGHITKIRDENDELNEDDETNEDDDEFARRRCRVLLHMRGDNVRIAVQVQGEGVNAMDGIGEGMFPDMINNLLELRRARLGH